MNGDVKKLANRGKKQATANADIPNRAIECAPITTNAIVRAYVDAESIQKSLV